MKHLFLIALLMLCTVGAGAQPKHPGSDKPVPVPTPIYASGEYFPTPPPPSTYIRARSAMQKADKGVIVLSASCEPGEVLLGGGYSWGPSSGIAVTANYPSSEATWTNEFHVRYEDGQVFGGVLPNFHATLTTIAYCMRAPGVDVSMQTVWADNFAAAGVPAGGPGALTAVSQTFGVQCPDGSVLTGGGFAVDGPYSDEHDPNFNTDIMASQPLVNAQKVAIGWTVSLLGFHAADIRRTRAYARCAVSGLKAAPVGEIDADLTKLPYALGESVTVARCGTNAVTTGGGHAHTGDWLISHWVNATKADALDYRSWRATSFGGYQTPRYDFRPCTPVTAQCLSANVIAACFVAPDVDYIAVRITSPPTGHAFGLERHGASSTERIAFTAEVYDRNGKPIPNARVRWTRQPRTTVVPPPGSPQPSNEEPLGTGKRLDTALAAGETLDDVIIKAYAVVRRPKKPQLEASDQIVLTVGTVP